MTVNKMTIDKRIEQLVALKDKRGFYFDDERAELIKLLKERNESLTDTLDIIKSQVVDFTKAIEDTNKRISMLKEEQEEEDKVWHRTRCLMFTLENTKDTRELTETEMRSLLGCYDALIDKKKKEIEHMKPCEGRILLEQDIKMLIEKRVNQHIELRTLIEREKGKYYFVSYRSGVLAFVSDAIDNYNVNDNSRYEKGNYFLTEEEAQKVADSINRLFTQLNKPDRRPKKQ